ncbi:MAG: serine hydroxymethyltransferase [Candidatus Tyloplasma litorale]|nr:MAG: serine hydroxymethyltransferase [Mycoplasmatales bacterium]
MKDLEIWSAIKNEQKRQDEHVELIASENFVSQDVLEATGSILTNKYAEGYPGKRYYGGCENVDKVEQLAIDRIKKLFNCNYANVQPHSGSQANFAAYNAVLNSGDKILGMALSAGGHLTHGFHVSVTSKYFEAESYGVDKKTHLIDFNEVRKKALEFKPKLIICGASAYSRIIDFQKFKEIADEIGALLLADVAHIAGLIVTGQHPNPFDYGVDIVTSTTHKTLRGSRGGIILTNDKELSIKIDKSIFPGTQGGPIMNIIAGKAIAFYEALQPEFKKYQEQVIKNAKAFANKLVEKGFSLVSGGTDNHLILVNVKKSFGITGLEAEVVMRKINITLNKNTVPFDKESPRIASGIRVGTPAMTTKGWIEEDFENLAEIMIKVFKNIENEKVLINAKNEVSKIIKKVNGRKQNE